MEKLIVVYVVGFFYIFGSSGKLITKYGELGRLDDFHLTGINVYCDAVPGKVVKRTLNISKKMISDCVEFEITNIQVTDNSGNNSTEYNITAGGVGTNFLEMEIESKDGEGIDISIDVHGVLIKECKSESKKKYMSMARKGIPLKNLLYEMETIEEKIKNKKKKKKTTIPKKGRNLTIPVTKGKKKTTLKGRPLLYPEINIRPTETTMEERKNRLHVLTPGTSGEERKNKLHVLTPGTSGEERKNRLHVLTPGTSGEERKNRLHVLTPRKSEMNSFCRS